jgi:GAF domain-containing protein
MQNHLIGEAKGAPPPLKQLVRLFRLRVAVKRVLAASLDEKGLLEGFCQTLVVVGGYRFVWLGFESGPYPVIKCSSTGFEDFDVLLSWAPSTQGERRSHTLQCTLKAPGWNSPADKAAPPEQMGHERPRVHLIAATAIPLRLNERTVGVLQLSSDHHGAFPSKERRMLSRLGAQLLRRRAALRERQAHMRERAHGKGRKRRRLRGG